MKNIKTPFDGGTLYYRETLHSITEIEICADKVNLLKSFLIGLNIAPKISTSKDSRYLFTIEDITTEKYRLIEYWVERINTGDIK